MRAVGRGLDWLNLFVANIQTGFGPFIAVYLTTQGWTQTQIGFALSIGTLTAMASQVPAGALVDAVPNKYAVGFFSILAFTGSALLFALWPIQLSVYAAEVLHGFSSCTLGPVIAAISLAIAGPAGFSLRLGRNVRFSSIGNGLGAILMGMCGYLLSERAVFFLTAALTLPALAALGPLFRAGSSRRPPRSAPPRTREPSPDVPAQPLSRVLADRRLLIFAACAALFTFANSPMLPLVSGEMTRLAPADATLLVAACIVLPQIVVAALSPSVGRIAQSGGHPIDGDRAGAGRNCRRLFRDHGAARDQRPGRSIRAFQFRPRAGRVRHWDRRHLEHDVCRLGIGSPRHSRGLRLPRPCRACRDRFRLGRDARDAARGPVQDPTPGRAPDTAIVATSGITIVDTAAGTTIAIGATATDAVGR
jgi:MFS family permease